MTALAPRAADVLLGTWLGALVNVEGVVHVGDWTQDNGMWGAVTTRCGIRGMGYLTAGDPTRPNCARCAGGEG
jgi:hypothetical protein